MATNIGEATIKLSFDEKGLEKSGKDAESKASAALSKLGSVAKTGGKFIAAGIAAGTAAVVGLATASVNAYKDFEQLAGGMEKIFDEVDYDRIAQDAQDAYSTMQISARQYMEQMAGVGAVFASTMGDEKGYETAKKGMKALADYASGTGASVEELMTKYQAITRSASGYLSIADQFAGILPQTTDDFLKQAQASGFLSEKYKKLTDVPVAEYQEAITNMIEKGVDAQNLLGNATEESVTTISGSLAALKAQWDNTIVALIDTPTEASLEEQFGVLATAADNAFNNLSGALETALTGIGILIEKLLPKVLSEIPKIFQKTFPKLLTQAVNMFGTLVQYVPQIVGTIMDTLIQAAQAIAPQIPMILIQITEGIMNTIKMLTKPENINAVIQTGVQLLMALVQAIPEVLTSIIDALPTIIENIIDWLLDPANLVMLIDAAVKLFTGLVMAVPRILGALIGAFGRLFIDLWAKISEGFKNFFGNFGETIKGVFKGAVNGVLQFIENFINGPIDILNGFIEGINATFGAIGVNMSKISRVKLPRLAQGGVANGATTAIIGEAGKEAVLPLQNNTDNWAGLLSRTLAEEFQEQGLSTGQGFTIYMTNNINNNLDADEIGERLMTSIRRAA